MGLKLTQSVLDVLQVASKSATFWSESTNTLWWIRENGRWFKPFVANHVLAISSYQVYPGQYQHVWVAKVQAGFPRSYLIAELYKKHYVLSIDLRDCINWLCHQHRVTSPSPICLPQCSRTAVQRWVMSLRSENRSQKSPLTNTHFMYM